MLHYRNVNHHGATVTQLTHHYRHYCHHYGKYLPNGNVSVIKILCLSSLCDHRTSHPCSLRQQVQPHRHGHGMWISSHYLHLPHYLDHRQCDHSQQIPHPVWFTLASSHPLATHPLDRPDIAKRRPRMTVCLWYGIQIMDQHLHHLQHCVSATHQYNPNSHGQHLRRHLVAELPSQHLSSRDHNHPRRHCPESDPDPWSHLYHHQIPPLTPSSGSFTISSDSHTQRALGCIQRRDYPSSISYT